MKFKTTPELRRVACETTTSPNVDELIRDLCSDLNAAQARIAELERALDTNQKLRVELSERMQIAERERDNLRDAILATPETDRTASVRAVLAVARAEKAERERDKNWSALMQWQNRAEKAERERDELRDTYEPKGQTGSVVGALLDRLRTAERERDAQRVTPEMIETVRKAAEEARALDKDRIAELEREQKALSADYGSLLAESNAHEARAVKWEKLHDHRTEQLKTAERERDEAVADFRSMCAKFNAADDKAQRAEAKAAELEKALRACANIEENETPGGRFGPARQYFAALASRAEEGEPVACDCGGTRDGDRHESWCAGAVAEEGEKSK